LQANFPRALSHVLTYEGGYSDHSSDPGGATKYGITHAVLAQHRGTSVTKADMQALTREEAAEIYRRRYWETARCAALPGGLDLAVFDCAVNQGTGRAARLLQEALQVAADGVIGPKTLAAIATTPPQDLLAEFMARRMRAYASLTKLFPTFGLGWSRRLMATHAEAIAMIASL
jgi:lysozyme family protein